MNSQEETYIISDAYHMKGTNRYVFNFSPHWRRTNQKALAIGIRSVKQILSTRAIWMEGFKLSDGRNTLDISPDISLSGSWVQLNEMLKEDRLRQYNIYKSKNPSTIFTSEDYNIGYEEDASRLNIIINETVSNNYKLIIDEGVKVSRDLLMMSGLNQDIFNDLHLLSNGNIDYNEFIELHEKEPIEIEMNGNNIIRISFNNIWNRDVLSIHASFVDLSYHQWLGVCNEQYVPPKEYPITYDDQKFWIELFTLDGREVELPSDQKDNIVIEAMMMSYL